MQLKSKLIGLLIAVLVLTLQSGIFASDTASVVLTKRPASFFQHKELIGASSTRISGTDKGVNITFTDPYSSSSMTRFAGTYKATIDGNSGSMYCIDIVHPIAKYSESQPHVYTDNGSTPSTITYILNNCYPNKSYPYTGSAGSVDNEAASVQAAIWHYSDGLDISKITNSTIKTRATKIISDCDSHSSEVSILTSFNIVPADQTITNYSPASVYAKAIDASGNPVSGLSVNFSTTYGTLSSSSVVTGSNGQTSAVTLTKGIPNSATITASTTFSFPQGTKFEESSGPNDYQKLVLATPTTANREAVATANWQISSGSCSTAGFITYTQGGWGSPNSSTPGALRDSKFSQVFASGLVVGGTKTAKFTSASAIENFLPASGTASHFTQNYTNSSSTSAGVLAGQAVALIMNINFNNAGVLGTNGTKLGDMIITSGAFAGKTVNELVTALNIAIGGSSTTYTFSEINNAATSINENFDNGTVDKGFLTCPSVAKGSIGDKVWNDANHNGIQDNNESGISGITVNLYDCSGNLKATTTTDANGAYSFTEVVPGSYNVGFVLPSGFIFTTKNSGSNSEVDSDADVTTGKTDCFTLASAENATKYDAGMYNNKATVGDLVWNDVNSDGIQNNGEAGIPGVTVKLYTCAGSLVTSTTTDLSGSYSFKDQAPGSYYVLVTVPSGYTVTTQSVGSDKAVDSDIDVTGKTACFTLSAGDNNQLIDAGMYSAKASLGDLVWIDANKNGVFDASEKGMTNVTVKLLDNSNNILSTTTTDANGIYHFTNLTPQSYKVQVIAPTDYSFTTANAGSDDTKDSDVDPSTGKTSTITLAPGANDLTCDAGLVYDKCSLGDKVWLDNNENGKQDAQEPGVKGITVELHNSSDNTLAGSTVTDSLGAYLFKDIAAGNYYIKVVIGSEHTFSPAHQADNDIDSDIDPSTAKSEDVTLAKGDNVLTLDAGIYNSKVSLGDLVWNDANHNGIQDNSEAGIANLTVSLYDYNDVFLASTTTDADGKYSFKNLNAGSYKVQFSLPAGFTFTQAAQGSDSALNSDADPVTGRTSSIALSAGTNDMTWDAGMYLMSASVGDKVWNDLNLNGLQDFPNSELGISNVVVKIYTSGGTLVSTTLTDITGEYKFSNLQPGDYFIKFYTPEGHKYSPVAFGTDRTIDSDADTITGKTAVFTLAPGDNKTDIDAGMYIARASVGDFVWNDINKNGVQDNGEDGLAEITIRLYSSADALIGSTITNSHGAYEFTNLMPGSYYIKFFAPVDYLISPKNAGNNIDSDSDIDPSTGKTANLTLSPGEYNNTIDAGMYLPDRNADLSISKSSSLSVANDGSQITFTVTVTNNGPADATNISVSDLLQKGFVFVSATPDGEYNPSTGVWTVGNIAANGNKILKISVKVSVADLNNAVLDLGPAKDYNMFVLEDLDQPSSDTQGKLAVGHDAHLTGYSVGDQLENSNGTEDVLVVGHDLYFGIGSIMRGNAVYGNHTNLPVNSVDILEGTVRKGHPIDFDAAKSYLNNLSAIVASQPTNGTYTFEYKQLLMTGNDPYFNVFAINGVDIAAANYVGVTVPNGSVVLINVSGENVSWAYGFEVKGTAKNNVLINFFEAKKLSLKNIDITGSILAPKADVDFTTGVQNGQMICKSYTGRGQMNLSPFVGNIPFSTTVINSAEVVSSDQNDPDSTPNNGLKTEDDYSEVSVVITNTNTESSSPLWKKTGTVSATQMPVSLTSESDGTLIAGTTNGGLFTTTNSGTSWTSISLPAQNGTVWGVDVPSFGTSADKAVSNEMIAATEKGVFMTTNGGSNWSASGLVNVDVRTVAKDNSGSIFAGTWGHGAYRSDDGGTMWVNVSAGLPSSTVAFSKIIKLNDGSVVAATFGNGMYRLSADKQSWTKLDFEYPFVWNLHQSVSGELYAATYGKGIFRSVNGGNTWQNISLGLSNLYIYAVSSDKNNNLAASSLNGGVFSMAKGKTNWSTLGLSGASVVSVAANPVNGQLVIASKNGSVMATAGTTGVKDNSTLIPKEYNLSQNYPNPFNPTTKIAVDIPMASEVTLMVYNILGQHIATLVNQQLQAGKYTFDFKANNFASGVYIYRLTAGKYTMTKKMILQK